MRSPHCLRALAGLATLHGRLGCRSHIQVGAESGLRMASSRILWEQHHQLSFAETFSTFTRKRNSGGAIREDEDEDESASVSVSDAVACVARAMESSERSSSSMSAERAVRDACDAYEQLDREEDKAAFLRALASSYSVDREAAVSLASEYSSSPPSSKLESSLRSALDPRYLWFFQRVGQLRGGVKFLVDLRADLIRACKAEEDQNFLSEMRAMKDRLRQLLSLWFSVGFLELEQVTWSSPCEMLQKVSDYEAVHPVRNWTDLKSRVGAYRRCLVYTHRSMPGEPIVVLHVALTEEVPRSIASVVKHHRMVKRFSVEAPSSSSFSHPSASSHPGEDPSLCKAAIFYSITSTQTGLQGIELGTHLIKQAVGNLREELPGLVHFSTLSPIPGFRTWLLTELQTVRRDPSEGQTVFTDQEWEKLETKFGCRGSDQTLERVIGSIKSSRWAEDDALSSAMETPLMRLCAKYLYVEKHRGFALCPVANFHLRNGAVLWRLNWRGDLSARGMANSCGVMVNYKYFLDDLEENSARYQETQEIRAGEQVLHLAKKVI